MPSDNQEPNRMFGAPTGGASQPRRYEPNRVLGFPTDMFNRVDVDFFRGLVHPVKSIKRWNRRRRLGAYAVDEDTPSRNG
jgi:hypothetical protein